MSTDHTPLDPTETDQSDLIIDPESLTQWVDGTIPSPHKMSVDNLAVKFPVLTEYKKDSEQLSSLFREAFSSEIVAPAHTICRVMTTLKKELGVEETLQETACREKTAHTETGAIPQKGEEEPPFVIHFPEHNKKIPRYLLPAAALLFLMALVGSIIHSEHSTSPSDTLAQKDRHNKNLFPFSLKKHRSMDSAPRDPHSTEQGSRAHLTTYDTTGGENVLTKEQEEQKKAQKEKEEKKEQEGKNHTPATPSPDKNAVSSGTDKTSTPSR